MFDVDLDIEEQDGHSHSLLAILRSLEEINGQKSVGFDYCIGSVQVKLEVKFTFPAVATF